MVESFQECLLSLNQANLNEFTQPSLYPPSPSHFTETVRPCAVIDDSRTADGAVDTAFISSLGVNALAALGVGTTALSSLFWIFNFLGIATQTEVAQGYGSKSRDQARGAASLSLLMALGIGILLALVLYPLLSSLAILLGADGEVLDLLSPTCASVVGCPAVLLSPGILWNAARPSGYAHTTVDCPWREHS